MPFTTIQVISKEQVYEDSASISHNTDVVKLSEIIDLQELTSEAQELPVYRIFSVIHRQRIDEVAARPLKRWPKSLSKSTNSEGYTLDSFSE